MLSIHLWNPKVSINVFEADITMFGSFLLFISFFPLHKLNEIYIQHIITENLQIKGFTCMYFQ